MRRQIARQNLPHVPKRTAATKGCHSDTTGGLGGTAAAAAAKQGTGKTAKKKNKKKNKKKTTSPKKKKKKLKRIFFCMPTVREGAGGNNGPTLVCLVECCHRRGLLVGAAADNKDENLLWPVPDCMVHKGICRLLQFVLQVERPRIKKKQKNNKTNKHKVNHRQARFVVSSHTPKTPPSFFPACFLIENLGYLVQDLGEDGLMLRVDVLHSLDAARELLEDAGRALGAKEIRSAARRSWASIAHKARQHPRAALRQLFFPTEREKAKRADV